MSRRWLDPETAADIGKLDPEAIARVRAEAWPDGDQRRRAARCAGLARLPHRGRSPGERRLERLAGRAGRRSAPRDLRHARRDRSGSPPSGCRMFQRAVARTRSSMPAIAAPAELCRARRGRRRTRWSRSCAAGWKGSGPVTAGGAGALARPGGRRDRDRAARAGGRRLRHARPLHARARTTTNGASAGCSRASTATRSSACARRSSRSRRATSCASCSTGSAWRRTRAWRVRMRSTRWSRSSKASKRRPAPGKREILPARITGYEPAWLDDLCLAGRVAWARLRSRSGAQRRRARRRRRCAPRRSRCWRAAMSASGRSLIRADRRGTPSPRRASGRRLPARTRRLVLRRDRRRQRPAAHRRSRRRWPSWSRSAS